MRALAELGAPLPRQGPDRRVAGQGGGTIAHTPPGPARSSSWSADIDLPDTCASSASVTYDLGRRPQLDEAGQAHEPRSERCWIARPLT